MPAYTLGEIMSQATLRTGRRADLDTSAVSFLANEAYLEVAGIYPRALSESSYAYSVQSGVTSLTLPADFDEPIDLFYTAGSRGTLQPRDLSQIDSASTARGTPSHFAFFKDALELWPSPNSNFSATLRYRARPSDLTATSAVPSMDTDWRPLIVTKLEEKIHLVLGNYEAARVAQDRFLSQAAMLRSDEARRRGGEWTRGVRVVGY